MDNDLPSSSRSGNGAALFSSTKCPPGPGLESSCELPFGFLWTPLSAVSDYGAAIIQCDNEDLPPVVCLTCLSYLNLYASFNVMTGEWTCPLCGSKNVAPPQALEEGGALSSILAQPCIEFRQQLIPEDDPDYMDTCSIIMVLDQNLPAQEAQAVGSTMQSILSEMDTTNCRVKLGLIVFGKAVSVYQLGLSSMLACCDVVPTHEFLTEELIGERSYTTTLNKNLECLWRCLSAVYGITLQGEEEEEVDAEDEQSVASRLSNKSLSRLERLRMKKEARLQRQESKNGVHVISNKSPWTSSSSKLRGDSNKRCTGEAIQCAIELATVDAVKPSRTSRILLFTNGCPNHGDGSVVVDPSARNAGPDIVDAGKLAQSVEYFGLVAKAASEVGVAMDVLCTGVLELALPAYQALVEPSSGYVLPHASFCVNQHLQSNLEFILNQTFVAGLHFDFPDGRANPSGMPPLTDRNWVDGCILDLRMPIFLTPTHYVGPGELLPAESRKLLANERSAFAFGAALAAKRQIPTTELPNQDMVDSSLTRVRMGRSDPVSTFSVLVQVNEFFQHESHGLFQCIARYLDRGGKELVTRVFTQRMAVAKNCGEFLDAVDEEVIPVLLGKEAVYRSLFGREMNKKQQQQQEETPDAIQLENLAHDAQRDLDATIQRISGAFRLLGLENGTTRNGLDLTEEGGVRAAGSSVDFAFPPELADALRRLYHFRRGPLLSPGPMQSLDDRAQIRSLFLRLPLEDCLGMMALSLWSNTAPLGAAASDPLSVTEQVPPETLALWDNSILAGDHFFVLFVWSGRYVQGSEYDTVRDKLKAFLLERAQRRFPTPTLYMLSENDSMSRRFTALLAPSHGDPPEHQVANFPALSSLTQTQLLSLQSKFKFYDPSTDASFRNWFWTVASASGAYKDEGISLCE